MTGNASQVGTKGRGAFLHNLVHSAQYLRSLLVFVFVREVASFMVTAGATANTTLGISRAFRALLCVLCLHSHGENIRGEEDTYQTYYIFIHESPTISVSICRPPTAGFSFCMPPTVGFSI